MAILLLRFGFCLFGSVLLTEISLSSIPKLLHDSSHPDPTSSLTNILTQEVKGDPLPQEERLNQISPPATEITCDRTEMRYDLCSINGPTVLDPITLTFFTTDPSGPTEQPSTQKIRPYPRKFEDHIMAQIKDVTLSSGPSSPPPCRVQHDAPALVFSAGGYTGNFFHDFNDGFIPLFITVNTIFPNREDFIIVLSEAPDWYPIKYADLLHEFSTHPVISLRKNDSSTHCFPSAKLGLITHGFMTINETLIPNSEANNFTHFRRLLENAYGKFHNDFSKPPSDRRPRLVIPSRDGATGRRILNQKKLISTMERIGFEVVVFKPRRNTSLHESYALVNSSQVMVGVHGAGMTHAMFLQPGAVLIQVVPIGINWAAQAFFGRAAPGLELEYMEYKIGVEESSLVKKYGKESMLVKDPFGLQKNGWPQDIMNIYLKEQNVKINIAKFEKCLKEAYKKAQRS